MKFDQLEMLRTQHDMDALANLVRRFNRPKCVEVGTWAGGSTLDILRGGAKVVHCVDTWLGSPNDTTILWVAEYNRREGEDHVYKTFLTNMEPWIKAGRVIPHRMTSLEAAAAWTEPMDFIYIDAGHLYHEAKSDIEAWWPHVREGGILAGHDYGERFIGVTRAVREFGGFEVVPGSTVWWRRKT
jgi:hypothetical protein